MAGERAEDKARAARADVINIGKGLPSQVAQSYGQVVNTGQAGVGGANQTTGTSSSAMTNAMGGFNTALSGYNQSANITNMGYQNEMAAFNAGGGMADALGGLAGMGMSMTGAGGAFGAMGAFAHDGGTAGVDGNPRSKATPAKGAEVPMVLEKGEYIVPREVVAIKGTEFFDKLVERHAPAKAANQAIPTRGSK